MFRSLMRAGGAIRANRALYRNYAKDVKFGSEVRAMMLRGVDVLADAVAVTMGPKGRSVILERGWTSPKITKDGVTVARAISLQDKHMNLGARLVQDVAHNTNESAGDGTTTATVLARAIAKEGFSHMISGANPVEIRRGVLCAVEKVKSTLKEMSRPVQSREEIEQVATISANGDEAVGRLIAEATDRVGRKGTITVKEGKRLKDELEIIQGLQFDKGYVSPFFVNCPKGSKVELANAYVLITLQKITTLSKIVGALELSLHKRKPLLIIAEDISGEALNALVMNKLKLGLQICAVKAPSFGEYRKELVSDIAAATGATIFGDDANYSKIERAKIMDLGEVGEAIITKESTMLLRGSSKPDVLDKHIKQLKAELLDKTCDASKRERLRERLSHLTNGVAVLRIGGASEVEVSEKRDRITDALNATRAAIEEGIVPGGGTAFLRCIPQLHSLPTENKDHRTGIHIVCNALRMPTMTIAANAGVDAAMVVAKVMSKSGDYGYDAMRNKYGQLMEMGIIDPTKVVRTAISDAAGVASLLSTTEVVITDVRNKELLAKLAGVDAMNDVMNDLDGVSGGMSELEALSAMDSALDSGSGSAEATKQSKSNAEINEMVKSMPGYENVEVHDIDPEILS